MSRWFRFYDDVINDPKVLSLAEPMRWSWVAVLCAASKNDGALPAIDHLALMLRVPKQRAAVIVAGLHSAGLLDKTETGFEPHNWNGRQYKSDVSTERVKRFRNGKRNATANVPETPPETDTETDTEARASDAIASDPRTRLFRDGLPKLASLTGKGPDACRSFVGKCLKAAGDDAVVVLGLIEEAERNQAVDPSAWIVARLKGPNSNGQSGSKIIQAADNLIAKLAEFDGPAGGCDDLRSDARQDSPRLLSHG